MQVKTRDFTSKIRFCILTKFIIFYQKLTLMHIFLFGDQQRLRKCTIIHLSDNHQNAIKRIDGCSYSLYTKHAYARCRKQQHLFYVSTSFNK